MQAGLNSFALTPKQWIERTRAVGIISKTGATAALTRTRTSPSSLRRGFSVEFKLYLIKEFQRLKETRAAGFRSRGISTARSRSSITAPHDAINSHLIPPR